MNRSGIFGIVLEASRSPGITYRPIGRFRQFVIGAPGHPNRLSLVYSNGSAVIVASQMLTGPRGARGSQGRPSDAPMAPLPVSSGAFLTEASEDPPKQYLGQWVCLERSQVQDKLFCYMTASCGLHSANTCRAIFYTFYTLLIEH